MLKISTEHGTVTGLVVDNKESLYQIGSEMSFGINADEDLLSDFLSLIEEKYHRVGFIKSVHVEHDHRGKGAGKELMAAFLKDHCQRSQIDFLFAATQHPQQPGFNLVQFYKKQGFEPVFVSNGDVCMVNKGQARTLKHELGFNIRREEGCNRER